MRRPAFAAWVWLCFALTCGCAAPPQADQAAARDADRVAEVMAKAAIYIFNTDFAVDTVEREFTEAELAVMAAHLGPVVQMIERALGVQQSVGGAMLAGHFELEAMLRLLRGHFLTPSRAYGWEGPDYSDPESWLLDEQYVYDIHYLEAIERITGKPIHEAIELTDAERRRIDELASVEGQPGHIKNPRANPWAVWMQRKLKLRTE